jgi:hypothetical protein
MRPNIQLTAEDLELLHFLIGNERARILRESPEALDNFGSYAARVNQLHGLITTYRDANLT